MTAPSPLAEGWTTIRDAAVATGYSRASIYNAIARGAITSYNIGAITLVRPDSLTMSRPSRRTCPHDRSLAGAIKIVGIRKVHRCQLCYANNLRSRADQIEARIGRLADTPRNGTTD